MALTKKDIKIIQQALQPSFDELKNDLKKFELSVNYTIKSLQIYMDARFAAHEMRFENQDRKLDLIRVDIKNLHKQFTPTDEFENLQKHVTSVEKRQNQTSC